MWIENFDDEGRFFAAFDRDAPAAMTLTARLADGRMIESPLTIAPREWNIEHINAARTPGGASAAFMKIRQPELDAIWDARLKDTGSTGWTQDFIWPVTGRISGRFGSQRVYRGEPGSYHSGIVQIALMDGSVRLISENIDGNLWTDMGTRSGGEVFSEF